MICQWFKYHLVRTVSTKKLCPKIRCVCDARRVGWSCRKAKVAFNKLEAKKYYQYKSDDQDVRESRSNRKERKNRNQQKCIKNSFLKSERVRLGVSFDRTLSHHFHRSLRLSKFAFLADNFGSFQIPRVAFSLWRTKDSGRNYAKPSELPLRLCAFFERKRHLLPLRILSSFKALTF